MTEELVVDQKTLAAYEFVNKMVPKADGENVHSPWWHGWALREAFLAGTKWQAEHNVAVAEAITKDAE